MRKDPYIVPVLISVLLTLFVSCSKESPAYDRENIKASWIVEMKDYYPLSIVDYNVLTFMNGGELECYSDINEADTSKVWGRNSLSYEVYCCDMKIEGKIKEAYGFVSETQISAEFDFLSSNDSVVTLSVKSAKVSESDVTPSFQTLTLKKLPSDYAATDSLQGIWQFNTRSGEPFEDYRIQFNGERLGFYERVGENEWRLVNQEDLYTRYSSLLILRLFSNKVFGTPLTWDVKKFLIDELSPSEGSMILRDDIHTYKLSYISAN